MDVCFKNIFLKLSGFFILVVFFGIFIVDVSNYFFFECIDIFFMMKYLYLFILCIVNYICNDVLINKK